MATFSLLGTRFPYLRLKNTSKVADSRRFNLQDSISLFLYLVMYRHKTLSNIVNLALKSMDLEEFSYPTRFGLPCLLTGGRLQQVKSGYLNGHVQIPRFNLLEPAPGQQVKSGYLNGHVQMTAQFSMT